MKLKCEICGDSNIIKINGGFTCQKCGVTYSLDELKSIFVDNSLPDSDSDERLKMLYIHARLAMSNGDNRESLACYNQIYQINPFQWEPMFYKGYLTLSISTEGMYCAQLLTFEKYCEKALLLLKEEKYTDEEVNRIFNEHVKKAVSFISGVAGHFQEQLDNYHKGKSQTKYYFDLVKSVYPTSYNLLIRLGNKISSIFSNQSMAVIFWKAALELNIKYLVFVKDKEEALVNINKTYNVILGIDPNYKAPAYKNEYYETYENYWAKLYSDSIFERWGTN